jgi:hypothetical protein
METSVDLAAGGSRLKGLSDSDEGVELCANQLRHCRGKGSAGIADGAGLGVDASNVTEQNLAGNRQTRR